MITQIFSEYYMIMKAITDEICRSFELPHSIFVMKIVNADNKGNKGNLHKQPLKNANVEFAIFHR
jgi:hypothetical protein